MREWVERQSTTQPTLTRRCAPASPCQGEAFLCCFVGNSRQFSVRFLNGANPSGRQCRGDPVGRPAGPWCAGTRDDAGPSCTIAPGRRNASPLHAPRGPPSPGAPRRPLPGRERRFLVASLETAGSFLSAQATAQTPLRPFGGGEGEVGGSTIALRRSASPLQRQDRTNRMLGVRRGCSMPRLRRQRQNISPAYRAAV